MKNIITYLDVYKRQQLHSRQRVMITPTTTMIIPMITAVGMIIAAVMTAETAAWIMVF